jgi:hypothetical protein
MSDEDAVESTRGVSRRTALKGIGAGAAVAWTAPTLLSLSASGAAAGSAVPCQDCTNGGAACEGIFACGNPGPGEECNCWVRADGNGNCCGGFGINHQCSPANACGPNLSCPPGYVCIASCCGNACVAPCGSGLQPLGAGAAAAGSGSMTA